MPSLLSALLSARSALLSNQSSMAVISHNMSNANTDGYTRQSAEMVAMAGIGDANAAYGFGVDVASVTRSRNDYIDRSLRSEQGELSRNEYLHDQLSQLSQAIGDPTEGDFVTSINEFWSSWQDLANAPESIAARASVQTAGQEMCGEFQRIALTIDDLSSNANSTIDSAVTNVNQISASLVELNRQIARETSQSRQPNDLMDQRDKLLDQLAKLGNVSTSTGTNGAFRVQFGDTILVEGESAIQLRSTQLAGKTVVMWEGGDREVKLSSGQVAGACDTSKQLNDWRANLDTIAKTIADKVNEIHRVGRGLDGSTGVNFFAANITSADQMRLDPSVLTSVNRIAGSGAQGTGDGLTARAIGKLSTLSIIDGKTVSASISGFIGTVGTVTAKAENDRAQAEAGVQQMDTWQKSVSGVNVDEELMNMMKYQQSFAAAGKVYTIVNSMMDTILKL